MESRTETPTALRPRIAPDPIAVHGGVEDPPDEVDPSHDEDIEAAQEPGCTKSSKKDMRKRGTTGIGLGILLRAARCLERTRAPSCCRFKGSPKDICLISGLERVVRGNTSAADAVMICGIKPPRYFFYMVSGSFCDVIQFFLDFTIHFFFNVQDPSLCWALGFGGSIIFRHTSHRYLVFGDYVGGYWRSLMRMYGGYSIIIVLSTLFNLVMTKCANFPHYVAWVCTLLWTGIVNYFILKRLWSFGGD